MIGRRLSHYEILDEISRGGMGVVYRARDINLGREIALKVLPEDLSHDRLRHERLVQEARAASVLEHPHIAVIHEVGEAEGVTFIAMELIRGEKMSELVARGPLPPKRAIDLAIEIAEGLARAHEKTLIHRDLKPSNVMVSEEGHAKIIDFGLAKLLQPATEEASTVSMHGPRTNSGVIMGTAAYMSPEQARGLRVDHRGDIFSFGVMLYEMLTGRRAFRGASSLDTMHAIITQPMPALPTGDGLSAESAAEMQRVVDKCAAKDPDDRYQGMRDIIVDLRHAKRRFESTPHPAIGVPSVSQPSVAVSAPPRRRLLMSAVAALAVIAAAAVLWWSTQDRQTHRAGSTRPSIAVLYFENNTGDSKLDWMRTGLTDMIVTDLSQSTQLEVLGTDRLFQILQDLHRTDDRAISADVVQQIANRAGVDNVLVGSYVRAGETIRISARLQDAKTGRIVTAERVEGSGEASVFSLVDELARRFQLKVAALGAPAGALIPRPGSQATAETGLDRGLVDITTKSIDAYRYYAEGMNFHERSLETLAEPLLEKAVEIDPDFAMAYAKLAVINNNLGLTNKRDDYAKRALDRTERLTARERYYIEGFYYCLRLETMERGLQAYAQGLALHPEHQASRHNLGIQYLILERLQEAVEQYEELIRRGTSNPTSYSSLAQAYYMLGNSGRARQVQEEFVGRYPENASGLRGLGEVLIVDGRIDEAKQIFAKAVALDPSDFRIGVDTQVAAVLQGRWTDAEAVSTQFLQSANPFVQFLGLSLGSSLKIVRGRTREALDLLARTRRVPGISTNNRVIGGNWQAELLLQLGKPAEALALVQSLRDDARGREPEFETLRLLAVAQAAVGQGAASDATLAELEARAKLLPSEREQRSVRWIRGAIAFRKGDITTAVAELDRAQGMLPVNGPVSGPRTQFTNLRFDAAVANLKAGREVESVHLFERIQSGHDRFSDPFDYVRSLFLLGQIYEKRGDLARAREQYAQFLDLWKDGDAERTWIDEARRKIAR